MKDLVIIGSGGFSKQVIEIVEQTNAMRQEYNLIGIIDDNKKLHGTEILGYEVIGDTDFIEKQSNQLNIHGVIAIAKGNIRNNIASKLNNIQWTNLIHPSAVVSNYVQMGLGNIICAGVIINPNLNMGNHCHINIGSTVGHDVSMMDYVTIMPGCRVSGNVTLESHVLLGTNSTIIQGLNIEDNVVLGAGALVVKDTVANGLYTGVPATNKNNHCSFNK